MWSVKSAQGGFWGRASSSLVFQWSGPWAVKLERLLGFHRGRSHADEVKKRMRPIEASDETSTQDGVVVSLLLFFQGTACIIDGRKFVGEKEATMARSHVFPEAEVASTANEFVGPPPS
jgi:hypothetical protein